MHILIDPHDRILNKARWFYDGIIRMILLRLGLLSFIGVLYLHGKIRSIKDSKWSIMDGIMVTRNLVFLDLASNCILICWWGSKGLEEGEVGFWMWVLPAFGLCCSFLRLRSGSTSLSRLFCHRGFRVLEALRLIILEAIC